MAPRAWNPYALALAVLTAGCSDPTTHTSPSASTSVLTGSAAGIEVPISVFWLLRPPEGGSLTDARMIEVDEATLFRGSLASPEAIASVYRQGFRIDMDVRGFDMIVSNRYHARSILARPVATTVERFTNARAAAVDRVVPRLILHTQWMLFIASWTVFHRDGDFGSFAAVADAVEAGIELAVAGEGFRVGSQASQAREIRVTRVRSASINSVDQSLLNATTASTRVARRAGR